MVRIAVDGMGGDFAPQAIVKGAEQALKEKVAEIILVGDKARLVPFLENPDEIEIVHTDEYVEMTASPSAALRKKRGSSVNKSFELVRTGKAQGVVTAGNSGLLWPLPYSPLEELVWWKGRQLPPCIRMFQRAQ